jgi:uncharacterized membrane protein YvlD (DUF360 family)
LTSKLDPQTKALYRSKYIKAKKVIMIGTFGGVTVVEGVQLAKDVVSSKLKAHAYKSLFAVLAGPIVQVISVPLYVFTYGKKVRKIAVALSEVGGKISKGEMGIANWMFLGLDLAIFGEPIPITQNQTFMILDNETDNVFD